MHIAVLIVGYRNLSDIKVCLAGLAASSHSDFEVVICENGGQGAFAELEAGLAGARSKAMEAIAALISLTVSASE